jgi:iron-sulfur cluster assembly accessory protein
MDHEMHLEEEHSLQAPEGIALFLTDVAVEKVREVITREGVKDGGLRVAIVGGGCSGFQYNLSLDESPREDDTVIEQNGVKLFLDPISQQYVYGTVIQVGSQVDEVQVGEALLGFATSGAYAEYAVASAGMTAPKPRRLGHVECASVPVVAVTAWQMLFEYADAKPGHRVLILGGAGNVGAYAVQLAARAGKPRSAAS